MSFAADLQFGQEAEARVAEYFRQQGYDVEQSKGYDKAKDMTLEKKVEVKYDRLAVRTGNIAIEVRYKGLLSGLSSTKATDWVICTDQGCWLAPVTQLRAWVKDVGAPHGVWHTVKAGDDKLAEVVLVPYDLIQCFKKII